ncbi:MAG: protoheme IX farnesyltransferase [Acidobacteria bacterium]|nr:protoheme IX farnesyltransferase [Acidobacteriota bacterium]MBK8149221.1 protoheme IX farnesyltransferase [Acidobacteriota bacterium]MBK8811219.1 protoheme IX farnesyltransferase [Acidobacteriota bacterium]
METIGAELEDAKSYGLREKLAAYFELTKPRIAFMLVLTSAAGFYLGSSGGFDFVLFTNSVIGITLLAFGVATLNQYLERRTDALMDRTAKRPLPTSKISPNEALVFGLAQCATAELYLWILVNGLTAILGLVVIVGYVLLYTPLKTRTSASTAIGAIPGAMPPLMGWTSAADNITLAAWTLFTLLFLWQFPHFLAIAWMYKDQYAKAGILMLPVVERDGRVTARQIVVFTLMLLPISLTPFFIGLAGVYYLIGASLLGIWFLWASVDMARTKSVAKARRLLLVSVIYLPLIFALMVLNRQ